MFEYILDGLGEYPSENPFSSSEAESFSIDTLRLNKGNDLAFNKTLWNCFIVSTTSLNCSTLSKKLLIGFKIVLSSDNETPSSVSDET